MNIRADHARSSLCLKFADFHPFIPAESCGICTSPFCGISGIDHPSIVSRRESKEYCRENMNQYHDIIILLLKLDSSGKNGNSELALLLLIINTVNVWRGSATPPLVDSLLMACGH